MKCSPTGVLGLNEIVIFFLQCFLLLLSCAWSLDLKSGCHFKIASVFNNFFCVTGALKAFDHASNYTSGTINPRLKIEGQVQNLA